MMRILAFAALVGGVSAGLTPGGKKCGVAATGDSPLCQLDAVKAKVDAEYDALTGTSPTCSTAACPCWGCLDSTENPFVAMSAAEQAAGQQEIADGLTVMTETAAAACSESCFGGANNGPIKVPSGTEFSLEDFSATASWCGQWSDRQETGGITCAETIFDAKGLLFLTIIGGALATIFFQCSIAATSALLSSGSKDGDAKP